MSYNIGSNRVSSDVLANKTRRELLYEMVRTEVVEVGEATLAAGVAGYPENGINLAGRPNKAINVYSTTEAVLKLQTTASLTADPWATIQDPRTDEDLSWTVEANGSISIPFKHGGVFYRLWVTNAAETVIGAIFVGGP